MINGIYKKYNSPNYFCFADTIVAVVDLYYPDKIDSIDIAENLGICIPYGSSAPIKNVRYSNNSNDLGIKVNRNTIRQLKEFFYSNNIGLDIEYEDGKNLLDWQFEDYVTYKISDNSHVICCYDYNRLLKINKTLRGHASLLYNCKIDKKIGIFNATQKDKNLICNIDDLFVAMRHMDSGCLIRLRKLDDNE